MSIYHISKTDGNDSYNGLFPTFQGGSNGPWLTLAKSVSSVSEGDIVYLRAGTWEGERLYIQNKSYGSETIWARYPSDAVGSAILDGTGIDPFEHEDAIIFSDQSKNVTINGIKCINGDAAGIALWGPSGSSHGLKVINCITQTTHGSGIITYYVDGAEIQYNKIYYACVPTDGDELLSLAAQSTNIDVSYNEIYAGNRNFSSTGGEGLNVKDGCSYIYVHHNLVDQARPDTQESDRYCAGVDGWTHETHHIYFYKNILKNGSWGLQYNSEEGGYTHHIYGWNNIIIHCGHSSNMHGGGLGFPSYGGSPGDCDYCYWWNNTIYDCYYGFRGNKDELGTGENYVQNNIFNASDQEDIHLSGSDPGDITFDHNLASTDDPDFDDVGSEDFHIGADSDARNEGTTLSYPVGDNEDYDGVSRPQESAFDIGAYEYEETNPSPNSKEVRGPYIETP